jgi:NADH-quinone oxidoreductase subunit H
MALGWKILIPGSLVWIMMIATIRDWRRHGGSTGLYIVGGFVLVLFLAIVWLWETGAERRRAMLEPPSDEPEAASAAVRPGQVQGFPVPPLDLPHYHGIGVTEAGHPEGSRTLLDAGAASNGQEVTGA